MSAVDEALDKALLAHRLFVQDSRDRAASSLRADLFSLQIAFIEDPHKRKTLVCGRRAGKTHALSRYLVKTALEHERANCLYVALTKPYAVALLWKELVRYCERLALRVKVDNLRHEVTFTDVDSRIIFGGVSSTDEREKLRGFPYHIVIADEVGSFGAYLGYLLEDVLQAALLDYDGTLVLAGTPSPTAAGAFYEAAHDKTGQWKNWHWTVLDNPRIPQWANRPDWKIIAKAYLDSVEERTPSVKFKREYLGSWIRDVDSLLYQLDSERNRYVKLPDEPFDYTIGADTGFNDASAIVVLAASRVTNKVYIAHEWSKSGVLFDALAGELKRTHQAYPQASMVIDPANKQLVESMKQMHSLPLESADKPGKRAHIDVLNSAIHQGTFLFPIGSKTFEQMSVLEWNKDRTRESESFPADLSDACLYAYTHVYNWHNKSEMPRPMTALEIAREEERKMIEAAVNKVNAKNRDPLGFDDDNFDWSMNDD